MPNLTNIPQFIDIPELSQTTDAGRLLSISCPALETRLHPGGSDVLLATSFTADERLSRMFRFDLDVAAQQSNAALISAEKLLGQGITINLALPDGTQRFFNGIINRFSEGDEDNRFKFYQIQIVPWFFELTLNSDCRIFQDLTVPEILKQVFAPFGPSRQDLLRTYTRYDYSVQYRETHFNFASRLMEQEGIFYFFEHNENSHVLVLADDARNRPFASTERQVSFAPDIGFGEREEVVTSWNRTRQLTPGVYTVRDHHFELPKKALEGVEFSNFLVGGNEQWEVYDYPGEYAQRFNDNTDDRLKELESQPTEVAQLRMEEEDVLHETFTGESTCTGLQVGFRVDLRGHRSLSGSYLVTALQHSVSQSPARVSNQGVPVPYSNSITCIAFPSAFRPARISLRPVVQGPQTAVVVGPDPLGQASADNDDIFTDQFGRIKVQFHWDRLGQKNEQSSCFLRVAQPWAGAKFGAIFIPRIGQEVLVDFLEGDPDEPIVIGSVYNRDNLPPYDLPANKTQSGIKTRSSKNGGSSNFNELRFEDKKGAEEIHIHAERTLNTEVEASESHSVGWDRSTTICHDENLVIKKGDRIETLEKGHDELTINEGDRYCDIVKGNDQVFIEKGNMTISVPQGTFQLAAKKVLLQATDDFTIQCGGSTINIDSAGVITVTGASMINMNATGIYTLTGALVKIN